MPAGRPSLYKKLGPKMLCAKVIKHGKQGMSEVEIADKLGVLRMTMRGWAEVHEEFSSALSRAKQASQAWWERKARTGKVGNNSGDVNPAVWKHSMNCRFNADYGDVQTHRLTDPEGKALTFIVTVPGVSDGE